MKPAPWLATVAFAGLLGPRYARANPMDMYGLGSRSVALAGAVTADVEDFSANYYNPAGLVRGRRVRLEGGYTYAVNRLTANGRDNHVDPVHGLFGGVVAPTHLFGVPFALGLALFVPDDRLARSRLLAESQPRWELYDNRVQRLYFAGSLALEPFRGLRLGAGVSYVASTRGAIGLRGTVPAVSPNDAQLYHTVDADVLSVFYPQAGIQIDPHPRVSFGLTYRGEFRFRLDLDAQLDIDLLVGRRNDPNAQHAQALILLRERAVTAFLPQQVAMGLALRPRDDLTVYLDATWVNWSAYISPTADVDIDTRYQLPPGSSSLTLPAIPPSTRGQPARFHDTLTPRASVEFRRTLGEFRAALRAGYRFDPTPVPDQTSSAMNFLDSNRHVVSAGLGATRGFHDSDGSERSVTVSVHGEVQLLDRRTILKSDPADPIGDQTIEGHVLHLGVTVASSF